VVEYLDHGHGSRCLPDVPVTTSRWGESRHSPTQPPPTEPAFRGVPWAGTGGLVPEDGCDLEASQLTDAELAAVEQAMHAVVSRDADRIRPMLDPSRHHALKSSGRGGATAANRDR
jgi:hypothetical protein